MEQLLSALLLQVLCRILMKQLNRSLLFRRFVGLSPDDRVWGATSLTKNREHRQRGQVFGKFVTKLEELTRGHAAAAERALLGRRQADRRVSLTQEIQVQGSRQGRGALGPDAPAGGARHLFTSHRLKAADALSRA